MRGPSGRDSWGLVKYPRRESNLGRRQRDSGVKRIRRLPAAVICTRFLPKVKFFEWYVNNQYGGYTTPVSTYGVPTTPCAEMNWCASGTDFYNRINDSVRFVRIEGYVDIYQANLNPIAADFDLVNRCMILRVRDGYAYPTGLLDLLNVLNSNTYSGGTSIIGELPTRAIGVQYGREDEFEILFDKRDVLPGLGIGGAQQNSQFTKPERELGFKVDIDIDVVSEYVTNHPSLGSDHPYTNSLLFYIFNDDPNIEPATMYSVYARFRLYFFDE